MEDKDIIICRCQEVSRQEILDAIAYINAHYAEKIDLETIASQIHLSKYYFCRIFREAWASVREKPVSVWWQESLRSRQDGPWRRSCRPRAESRYAR